MGRVAAGPCGDHNILACSATWPAQRHGRTPTTTGLRNGDTGLQLLRALGGNPNAPLGHIRGPRHAAIPASCRMEIGALCISRCGSCTKTIPPKRRTAATALQQRRVTPGGGLGSGASLDVNVRNAQSGTASRTVDSPAIRSGMPTPWRWQLLGQRPCRHSGHSRSAGPSACARHCAVQQPKCMWCRRQGRTLAARVRLQRT